MVRHGSTAGTVIDFNGFTSGEFTAVATVNPPDEKVVKSDSVHYTVLVLIDFCPV